MVLFVNLTKADKIGSDIISISEPVAIITSDISDKVNENTEYKLDGSKSTVPSQENIEYHWNTTCSKIIIISTSGSMAHISIGEVEKDENCEISLSVADKINRSKIASINFVVKNIDITAPEIIISGANPLTLYVGQTYTDDDIVAKDNGENISFTRTGNLNTLIPGTYTLTYTATDAADNTTSIDRIIIVQKRLDSPIDSIDIFKKYIAKIQNTIERITENEKFQLDGRDSTVPSQKDIQYHWESSCEYIKLIGQNNGVADFIVEEVNQDEKCQISLSVSDKNGRSDKAIIELIITNADKEAPVITLIGVATINIFVGESYTDQGALVTDDLDEDRIIATNNTVNTQLAGTYTLTYTATDTSGKVATPVTRTVIVSNRQTGGGGGGYISIIPPVNPITPQVLSEKITPQVLGEKIDSSETPEAKLNKAIAKYNLHFTRKLRKTNRDLKNNKDVSSLQNILNDLGYFKYPTITGYFGNYTEDALKKFQKANGLEPVGYIGPKTLKLLNSL